jgi:hypothetical protein
MNKILLVYEDYSDLMTVETALKKVGFDVIGLTSEYTIADKILEFNPELVVGSGKGGKVTSLGVGKRLKEMGRWQGKVVLLFPASFKPSPQDLIKLRVDMILESPVAPNRLIQVLAKLLGHDEAMLLDRLGAKVAPGEAPAGAAAPAASGKGGAAENDSIVVRGSVQADSQDASLSSEKIDENEDGPRGLGFRFGDRMSSAEADREASREPASEFPDVDLKAFENELMGGGAPAVERIEQEALTPTPAVPEDVTKIPATASEADVFTVRGKLAGEPEAPNMDATRELREAELGLSEKMAKYKALTADVKLTPKSNVSRVEARKRQRDLQKGWDSENLNDQDELRREFTKALFKK